MAAKEISYGKFDFVGKVGIFGGISVLLVVLSLGFLAIRGITYGIDFAGGTEIQVKFNAGGVTIDQLRAMAMKQNLKNFDLQGFGEGNEFIIRFQTEAGKTDKETSEKLAKKIKKFSSGVSKNGKKKQFFRIEFEALGKAQSDFVLSLLWGLREVLGEKETEKLVFGARKFLTTRDSDIRDGLVRALLRSCETTCESPLRDRMKIHQYFQARGL